MIRFLAHLRGGEVGGVKVRLDRLQVLSLIRIEYLQCIMIIFKTFGDYVNTVALKGWDKCSFA